jgi:hypothetical protein
MREGYQGKEARPCPRVYIEFELAIPDKRGDGKAFTVKKRWWASSNEKATMRKDIEVWRGKKFASDKEAQAYDLSKVLGAKCMINVQHDIFQEKEFAKIVSIMPAIPNLPFEPATLPVQKFELVPGFDAELLESFPDFLRAEIKSSPEYEQLVSGGGKAYAEKPSSGISATDLEQARQAINSAQSGQNTQITQKIDFAGDQIPF